MDPTGYPRINPYDADVHLAEVYDQLETGLEDMALLRRLTRTQGHLVLLEPFCGTGRMLIPLATDGQDALGMDRSAGMLQRARVKIGQLSPDIQRRIKLMQADVTASDWPRGFDLVILGGNCFYELAAPEEQEYCIRQSFDSLRDGGHLFIDNDHMEGDLAVSWQDIGRVQPSLHGRCSDGVLVETSRETIWFDVPRRLARFRRRTKVMLADGSIVEQECIQQKHPVSQVEVQGWLEKYDFTIEGCYGDYDGAPYTAGSPRAIFWARKG